MTADPVKEEPPQPLPLTIGDAALLLADALLVMGALESMAIGERDNCEPLPRGVLTCGEAWRLIPVAAALLFERFPQLVDEDAFIAALRDAALTNSASTLN